MASECDGLEPDLVPAGGAGSGRGVPRDRVINTILIGALQRRRELDAIGLTGATRGQLRRMALWEAGLVGSAAILVGGFVAGGLGWMVRHAISRDVDGAAITIPWAALGSIVVTALALVLAARLAGSAATARRRTA